MSQTPNQNPVLGSAGSSAPGGAQGRGQGRGPGSAPGGAPDFAAQPGVRVSLSRVGGRPVHNEAERVARWKVVAIPYSRSGLTATEQQMIAKLADACHQMDEIYLHQSDLGGWAIYHVTQNADVYRLFSINGSRWDVAQPGHDASFIPEEPLVQGHELYPFGTTGTVIAQYAAQHPEQKAAFYDPWTVVRSAPLDLAPALSQPVVSVADRLYTYPYHQAYAEWVKPMVADLRAAAKLSPDAAFAHYLNLRADALLSDDYHTSDIAWVELKDPKIDLIFGPYQTALDGVLGVKTSYGGAILIRNEAESRKLAIYRQQEAAMQQALPLPAEDKPSKAGQAAPMEVADAPLRAGDLHYGYQTVADNLPNHPMVKGSKLIFFKNFLDARVKYVVLPVAQKMLTPAEVKDVGSEGYLTGTVLQQIAHGLGPADAQMDGRQVGPASGELEEAKDDATGIFLAKWLVDQKLLPASELNGVYASYVAGVLQALRFGTGEIHGRVEMVEFNYLLEHGALVLGADGKCTIGYQAMPAAVASLAQQLLTFEARGDRAGVEAWFAKYDVMPPALTQALASTRDIPVDITPEFELAHGVRP